MDYAALGLDFHSIRNRNETRVINLLPGVLAEFPGKEIGRMEIARGMLYYIDLKAGKLMKAKGE